MYYWKCLIFTNWKNTATSVSPNRILLDRETGLSKTHQNGPVPVKYHYKWMGQWRVAVSRSSLLCRLFKKKLSLYLWKHVLTKTLPKFPISRKPMTMGLFRIYLVILSRIFLQMKLSDRATILHSKIIATRSTYHLFHNMTTLHINQFTQTLRDV